MNFTLQGCEGEEGGRDWRIKQEGEAEKQLWTNQWKLRGEICMFALQKWATIAHILMLLNRSYEN